MIERTIEIPAADGVTEALLVHPDSSDPLPAVINLTDGLGYRPAFAEQSKSAIAERGYVVLAPNIFYRVSGHPFFPFEPDFAEERTRERFAELKAPLTTAAMERDGSAYVDFLASQPFVGSGPIGVIRLLLRGKVRAARRGGPARADRRRRFIPRRRIVHRHCRQPASRFAAREGAPNTSATLSNDAGMNGRANREIRVGA